MTPQEKARALRPMIVKAAASLSDEDISAAPELCKGMAYDGALIAYKTRINWGGQVKMAALNLWDTEENNPDNKPELWTDIDYVDGIRKIKENMTAGEAFSMGEKGWWKGVVYASTYDGNVYTPDAYPAGWKEVQ